MKLFEKLFIQEKIFSIFPPFRVGEKEKWKRFLVKGVYNVSFIADGNMLSVEKLTIVK